MAVAKRAERVVATNRKAHHDFFIDETFEAGLVLEGTEVKSLRANQASLKEAYARFTGDELYLHNMHIAPYSHGNASQHEPLRTRKLLLHKRELSKLIGKIKERGYTLVPLQIYFAGPYAKVELGLGRGKKHFDKRRTIAERDAKREVERAVSARSKPVQRDRER